VKAAHAFPALIQDMDSQERICLLGLAQLDFLTPREKLVLIEMLGSPSRLLELSLPDLTRLLGRRFFSRLWSPDMVLRSGEETDRRLTADGIESIFYWDSSFPPQLREIFDPPVTLFVRGTLPDNGSALAAIVGTRFPTGAARTAAFRLGFECGREAIGVVSGLARGIDREAHEGCVAAAGISVAVLGSGIDEVYPTSSRAAARALLDRGGAIVSEYGPGTPPLRYHFPARNRIISGLSRAVVVVQAPEKSGALITAEYALEQGRDMYVHAAGITGSSGAGSRRLAEDGAPVIDGAADILRDWGRPPRSLDVPDLPEELPEGERIAALLRQEFEGACVRRAGELYWRT